MTITQAYLAGRVVSKEIFSRQANMSRNANDPDRSGGTIILAEIELKLEIRK